MIYKISKGRRMYIEDWQALITELVISKGFTWTKDDIDTMLLRLHSEVTGAGEALRKDDILEFKKELADIFVRLANIAEVYGIGLEDYIIMVFNENIDRPYLHGKKKK